MCRQILENQSEVERSERYARRLDAIAVRLARGRPAIDVAMGEVFVRLSAGELLLDVGAAKTSDFANELGVKPRDYFDLLKLARGLRERPILKQAVLAGEVSTVKALVVMDLAVGEDEAAWTARALETTVAGLKKLVKERGGRNGGDGDPSDAWGYETLRLDMTAAQQDRLDYALFLAKEMTRHDAPRWKLWDEIAREWLAFRQRKDAVFRSRRGAPWVCVGTALRSLPDAPPWRERVGVAGSERSERARVGGHGPLSDMHREETPLWRLRRAGEARPGASGASEGRCRIRLEKRMETLPQLRAALKSGKLTYTKAIEVARHATPADVEERIARAANSTHQQTKRDADAEEDRKDRARGEKKVRGPKAALDRVREAISSARQFFAVEEGYLEPGEAWLRVVQHYIDRWEVPLKRAEWRKDWEKEVMLRHGGLCAVPGCTRAAEQIHHIIFRKHDGPDVDWNCVACCKAHHLMCLHGGRLVVRGRGGEHLLWQLKGRELSPWQEWETRGDDDVHLRRRKTHSVVVAL